MIITLPFIKVNITSPLFYSNLIIIILFFFAGMTNPNQKKIIIGDAMVSLAGFIFFGRAAMNVFSGDFNILFTTNIVIAVIFLFTLYWSVATLIGVRFPKRKSGMKTPPFADVDLSHENTLTKETGEQTPEEERKQRYLESQK